MLCDGKYPNAIRTNYFKEKFSCAQDALEFISEKLSRETLMEGILELFKRLGYMETVSICCIERLYYVQYKVKKIFGIEIELI